jgi:TonB-linked SusC/RagA family outer membrane protein
MQIQAFCKLRPYVYEESKSLLTKTFLVMKLSAVLILVASLHVAARSTAQKVTYSGKDVELPVVLSVIREQTGYVFFYDKKDLKGIEPISVSLWDVPVEEALRSILLGLPLDFELQGNTVFITRKAAPRRNDAYAPAPEAAPLDTIRGYVRDSTGAPLQGATVTIKGTKDGSLTDLKGGFGLIHARAGMVIVISYTGFTNKEILITSTTRTPLFIMLQRSQSALDATIVQAYGTTSRRYNVGSISTVDAETIEKQPVTNVLLALEGQVPGLAVTATSGVAGSKVQLQVRGQNTITTNTAVGGVPVGFKPYDQPLLIIDGVPFAPQNNNVNQFTSLTNQQEFNGGISQFGGISPFASINPADIESITVLKDADATSIYGTQGSNGVILITTKKGKAGKTIFNLTATTGFNSEGRTVKFLNTPQYLQLRQTAMAQDSLTPSINPNDPGYAPDLTIFDQNKYTNWEKIIYGNTSNNTDVHGQLSGGTYNNTFIVSGGYTRSDFNYPGHFSDQRLSEHSALHHISNDNRLTIDLGVDFGYDQNFSASFGGNRDIVNPPNLPNLKNPDGSLVWSYQGFALDNYQFYANLLIPVNLQTYNFNNSLHLTYKILSGLSVSVNAGYSRNTSNETTNTPGTAQDPLYIDRNAQFANTNFQTVNVEPQIDYATNIGKGNLSALVGGTYKKNTMYQNNVEGYNYTNDLFLGSINGAGTIYSYDQTSLYRYDAGFGRLKYIYDKEFILNLTGRRDGSSNFGPGRQFGNFGSVGAGWIFTQEKMFKGGILSYGKISGSYGTSGSDGVGPYLYQAFWQAYSYIPTFQGTRPDVPQNLYNPNFSWATKKSLNLAADLGFFHDRVLLNITWYRDREGDQLGGYPLAAQAGFNQVLENLPSTVQNQGWEFAFTSTNIKTKHFSWNSSFNITWNRNKLLSFPNLAASPYADQYVIGKPTSVVFGYRYKDVNPTTGLFEYLTSKGQATYEPNYALPANGGDLAPIANREVKYMGGFGNTFTYKRVSLYLFFQFSSQTAPNWLSTVYGSYFPGFAETNEPTAILGKYWTGPGDTHATLQRLVTSYSSNAFNTGADFEQSSAAYSDDTYVRLKTVSLSYSLSDNLTRHIHIHDARIYCNVQNLFTLTDYKVADPELFQDYTAFPIQRIVAFGLNCNF